MRKPDREKPGIVKTVSIPDLARRVGCSRSNMFRRILRLAQSDMDDTGECTWLIRPKALAKMRVNESRLLAAHPALFSAKYVSKDELDEMLELLGNLRSDVDENTDRLRRLAATVRDLRQQIAMLQAVAVRSE